MCAETSSRSTWPHNRSPEMEGPRGPYECLSSMSWNNNILSGHSPPSGTAPWRHKSRRTEECLQAPSVRTNQVLAAASLLQIQRRNIIASGLGWSVFNSLCPFGVPPRRGLGFWTFYKTSVSPRGTSNLRSRSTAWHFSIGRQSIMHVLGIKPWAGPTYPMTCGRIHYHILTKATTIPVVPSVTLATNMEYAIFSWSRSHLSDHSN